MIALLELIELFHLIDLLHLQTHIEALMLQAECTNVYQFTSTQSLRSTKVAMNEFCFPATFCLPDEDFPMCEMHFRKLKERAQLQP